MANRIKGITIEIGGDTTDLQKSLKEVDSTLKTTQTNLKDINRLLKLDPSNTALLKQKQEELSKAITNSKDRLKQLKDALKQMQNAPNADQTVEQQKALQREIVESEQKLKSLKAEYKDFGSVAKQQLQNAGEAMKNVGGKISDFGGKMTATVTAPIVAGFTLAANKASDYEENLNKLDVAFGEYADKVQAFTDNAQGNFGLSKVDASESAAAFGALAKGIGLSGEQAADMSIELTKLSADLGSYFNTDIETAAGALEGIFTGNAQSLKQFGVVMTDTNLEEFAKSIGMTAKEYKALGQEDKTLLRYQYVLSTTADAQGDFERTNDGTANSIKTFQASLNDLMVTIGTQLLPIITPIIQKVAEFIGKLSQMNPAVAKIVAIVGSVLAVLGPVIVIIGKIISAVGAVTSAIGAIATPIGWVIAAIAAVVAAGVALYQNWDTIKQKASELWANITDTFQKIKDAITEKIDALVEKFFEIRDAIKEAFSFDNIKEKVGNFFSGIGGFFGLGGSSIMSGGYGMSAGGLVINNTFTLNAQSINEQQARAFANVITQQVNENLGRMI